MDNVLFCFSDLHCAFWFREKPTILLRLDSRNIEKKKTKKEAERFDMTVLYMEIEGHEFLSLRSSPNNWQEMLLEDEQV